MKEYTIWEKRIPSYVRDNLYYHNRKNLNRRVFNYINNMVKMSNIVVILRCSGCKISLHLYEKKDKIIVNTINEIIFKKNSNY